MTIQNVKMLKHAMMCFEFSHFGKSSVLLKAACLGCMALEQSHITQKDNYLLVEERGSCVYVCVRECERAPKR